MSRLSSLLVPHRQRLPRFSAKPGRPSAERLGNTDRNRIPGPLDEQKTSAFGGGIAVFGGCVRISRTVHANALFAPTALYRPKSRLPSCRDGRCHWSNRRQSFAYPHLSKTEFMLAFLRDNNTAASVADCFSALYQGLGSEDFERLFPVLLTDNGTEFSNPKSIEIAPDGHCRSRIFYCNPRASYQKPHIERNHEFLRMVLPKGSSFDHLSQQDINLVLSHINSYKRPVLGNKSPFEMFSFVYGETLTNKLLHLLCLSIIPGNNIILTPRLLRR